MPGYRLDPYRLDPAFDALGARVGEGRVGAAVLAVTTSGGTVRAAPFGATGDRPTRVDDRFWIASITKPIVATAVMQLAEAGRISLAEPLRTYLPELAEDRADVTARHVLTHTSGIPDRWGEDLRDRPTRSDLVELAFTAPLEFGPGSRYAYCSLSFYVLAELLARMDGVAFEESLRRRVLAPLGMDDTSFSAFEPGVDRWVSVDGAPGQTGDPRVRLAAVKYLASIAMPGGGLWSTAADLERFARAYLRGGTLDGARILGPAFIDLMGREQTQGILEPSPDGRQPPRDPAYAFGWGKPFREGDIPCSERAVEHGGATGTRIFVDPETDLAVVVLANRWGDREASRSVIAAVHGALVPA